MDTTSTYGAVSARWRAEGSRVEVHTLDDPGRDEPAIRWPDEAIPGLRQGSITFGPGSFPDLNEARELLPEYAGLWDAIRADRVAMLSEVAKSGPGAQDHAAFFDLPLHLTNEERRARPVDQ